MARALLLPASPALPCAAGKPQGPQVGGTAAALPNPSVLAKLPPASLFKLDKVVPPTPGVSNPVRAARALSRGAVREVPFQRFSKVGLFVSAHRSVT